MLILATNSGLPGVHASIVGVAVSPWLNGNVVSRLLAPQLGLGRGWGDDDEDCTGLLH